MALNAPIEWHYIDNGERCRCSCHPRLPDSDRHAYGLDCVCTRNREQRRESFQRALNGIREYWRPPESEQFQAAKQAAEADLRDWRTQQRGVVLQSHGGWAPPGYLLDSSSDALTPSTKSCNSAASTMRLTIVLSVTRSNGADKASAPHGPSPAESQHHLPGES